MSIRIYLLVNFLIILTFIVGCQTSTEKRADTSAVDDSLFITGAFFQGANGIYFDDQDQLHVASVVSRLIGIVDTETGAIIDTLDQKDGVEGPDDLTFGPDGSLYYTSILTGEVGRISPDGQAKRQFLSPGANPITFSDDGRLFVALDFQGDGLYELDPNLENEPRLIIKELGWLNAMDFGPDGYIYGPIWSKGHIVKIDVDSGELEVIVDDLQTPAAVKFNSKGELFTVDHQSGIVYRIDLNNRSKQAIARGFVGADNIAFNSKDELFLAHAQDGSIHQIYMDGKTRTIIPPALCNAADLEFINGQIIAPDILSMKQFEAGTGRLSKVWPHMIGGNGIIGPFTIDHEDGKLAMTSWFGNEVQVWDLENNEAVSTDHDYMVPINAILANESLIVAELGTTPGAAKVTRTIGNYKEVLMDASNGLIVPSGLAFANGSTYVADFFQGIVIQVTENDQLLDSPKPIINDLKQPEGLQIGTNSHLYIVETGGNRIVSINLKSNELNVVKDDIQLGVTGPAGMPPTWKLSDITFDDEGHIYIPSDIENKVYRFAL